LLLEQFPTKEERKNQMSPPQEPSTGGKPINLSEFYTGEELRAIVIAFGAAYVAATASGQNFDTAIATATSTLKKLAPVICDEHRRKFTMQTCYHLRALLVALDGSVMPRQ
jgi:hypothetical protein